MMSNSNLPPLSARMRPQSLQHVVGQTHLVAEGAPLHHLAQKGNLRSIILWGPPGVGKTTIAILLAQAAQLPLVQLSAIDSNVKEVRSIIERAQSEGTLVLFLDEIHRFNKAQQDSLLKAVENGHIILIGATTENPSFEVINALLSRCQVYTLQHISNEHLLQLCKRAIEQDEVLSKLNITLVEHQALLQFAAGDARKLLNILDLLSTQAQNGTLAITDQLVATTLQQNIVQFDKDGELHYDIISAFIKSMRGSDPNAALYWLARMIVGGEDPLFIARRMIIFASEDIGLANPNALLLAEACFNAVHRIGYPESRIILSETVIYLATSAKSNSAYVAIEDAIDLVRKTGNLPVPLHLRNAPTQFMKNEQYGKGYIYPHGEPGHFAQQHYLPKELEGTVLYTPADNSAEQKHRQQLAEWWRNYYKYAP